MDKQESKLLKEWQGYVVSGLCNGLSHTHQDGRTDDLVFWRKRCQLFNAFAQCIQSLSTNQSWQYSEKELKDIAEEGYKPPQTTDSKGGKDGLD